MATSSSSRANAELLARYPGEVRSLAADAAALIRRLLPGVEESVDPKAGLLAYGFGPGYVGMVCTLILSQKGVKLGIVRGAELDDPRGLLQGSGKVHKYVQLKAAGDLRQPGVNALITAAEKARQARVKARGAKGAKR